MLLTGDTAFCLELTFFSVCVQEEIAAATTEQRDRMLAQTQQALAGDSLRGQPSQPLTEFQMSQTDLGNMRLLVWSPLSARHGAPAARLRARMCGSVCVAVGGSGPAGERSNATVSQLMATLLDASELSPVSVLPKE